MAPPTILNIAGPECLSIREVCHQLGERLDRPTSFVGQEADTALLSNGQKAFDRYGPARVDAAQMLRWIADWIQRGQPVSSKPTHFDVRDGGF